MNSLLINCCDDIINYHDSDIHPINLVSLLNNSYSSSVIWRVSPSSRRTQTCPGPASVTPMMMMPWGSLLLGACGNKQDTVHNTYNWELSVSEVRQQFLKTLIVCSKAMSMSFCLQHIHLEHSTAMQSGFCLSCEEAKINLCWNCHKSPWILGLPLLKPS